MTPEMNMKLMEQFKKEMDETLKYKELMKIFKDDDYLEQALDEIMTDEYLHAKFFRDFLIENNIYKPMEQPDCEKKWAMITE